MLQRQSRYFHSVFSTITTLLLSPTPHSFKMPVKRSRAGSSTAYLETSVATASSLKVMKTDSAAAAAETKSFTVASPVNVGECTDRTKIGGFLERCHYCGNRIAQNSDVFMYSNFGAFCSVECRDCQINLDRLAARKPEN